MRSRAGVTCRDPKRPRAGLVVPLLFGLALVVPATPAAAQAPAVPSGFVSTRFAGTLASPTAMEFAPDGRLFISQETGALRVVKNGALLSTPFMTLSVESSGERGLLGIAFDPNFASNNFIYVYYTVPTAPIHNRISRFTANGDVVVPGSEFVVMDLDALSATNHNGGTIHFGPDGMLYVAVGENAVAANAQSLANRLGKILRINSNGTIPTDNPFFGTATGLNRAIWAMGLRNPFTIQFQPGTSRLYINDVGQDTWEEIDDGIAGANYGWPTTEGEFNPTTFPQFRNPLFAYDHSTGTCAITGGAFYPTAATNFPASYQGKYFYSDYCGGWIRTYDRIADTTAAFATGLVSPVDLKVGSDGSLYVLQRGSSPATGTGSVYRITYAPNPVTLTLGATTVAAGQPIQVTVATGPGNPRDWVGMHLASAADTVWVDWKYMNGTRTAPSTGLSSAVLTFTAPSMAGTYNFRFFQNDTYTKLTTSASFTVTGSIGAPALTVSTTSATPGQVIQVTVANGPGNPRDWVGMHEMAAADMGWLDWKYLSGTRTPPATGLNGATLNFTLPTMPGMYNFRLFSNDTFMKVTTSATVTVSGSTSGPTLTVSTTSATTGQVIQVTVANGPGNTRDWVALNPMAAADSGWVDWQYLSGTRTPPATGLTGATLSFTLPGTPGTYNFRFFSNNTMMKLATSATVTVQAATPTLTVVGPTTVSPGASVQVQVAGGPGNVRDWVGLHLATAGDTVWVDWKYLSGTRTPPATGATGATLTFTMPQTPGTYNFRFFRNDSYVKLATSVSVLVQ